MKALAAALVAAQKDMPKVERTGINPHFGSRFVTLDHLISKTRPVLAKHGLSIVQQLATSDAGAPALTTTLLHESGEQLSSTLPLPLVTDMQKLGAAITYARRYAWASALAICDEDDDDGNSVSGGVPSPAAGKLSAPGDPSSPGAADGKGAAAHRSAAAPDTFTLPFGKHKGKTIATVDEEDPGWLDWFLQNGNKEDIKDLIRQHRDGAVEQELVAAGASQVDDDEGIPF